MCVCVLEGTISICRVVISSSFATMHMYLLINLTKLKLDNFSYCLSIHCIDFISIVFQWFSSKKEMYRHLSVSIGKNNANDNDNDNGIQGKGTVTSNPWTIEQGISQFFREEQREIKCEKCNVGTTATQTMSIASRYV